MFIATRTKPELIKELKDHIEEDMVIHYICPQCDDEQVTYEMAIDEEIIETLEKEDILYLGLCCTNERCGIRVSFVKSDYIVGIETEF